MNGSARLGIFSSGKEGKPQEGLSFKAFWRSQAEKIRRDGCCESIIDSLEGRRDQLD